jgi:hypothetical protein
MLAWATGMTIVLLFLARYSHTGKMSMVRRPGFVVPSVVPTFGIIIRTNLATGAPSFAEPRQVARLSMSRELRRDPPAYK